MTSSAKPIPRSRILSAPRHAGCAVPAAASCDPAPGTVVYFPDPVGAWLAVVAAHDRVTIEEFLAGCIRERLKSIGLFPAHDLVDPPNASESGEGTPDGSLPGSRAPP
jgi:hypothetical protein